jgi:gluconate 2-dehydrogenase gamma chain
MLKTLLTFRELKRMDEEKNSRRTFLARSLSAGGVAWLAGYTPAVLAAARAAARDAHEQARAAAESKTPAKFDFFSSDQAADVEAMASQIIPFDETPGARGAGVIHFIDRALTTFDSSKQPLYTQGLRDLEAKTNELFPAARRFSALNSPQQVQVLTAIEKTDFFELVRVHTIMGFLSNPEYGGNRNKAGWKLIGFEDKFVYEPPFGFYDRDEQAG